MNLKFAKHLTRAVLAATLAFGVTNMALAAPEAGNTAQIEVTGVANRSIAPTYATLHLGITSMADNVSAAKSENDRVMSELIANLAKLGITKNNIQTSNFSVNPQYDYQTVKGQRDRQVLSYTVSNNVTVRINDLNKISQVIDTSVNAGANNIQSLSFDADISQDLTDQLTTEAVRNGRHQAEVIAAALGQQLKGIKEASISSTSTYEMDSTPRLYKAAALGGTSTPVEQGDLSVVKTVNLVFYVQ